MTTDYKPEFLFDNKPLPDYAQGVVRHPDCQMTHHVGQFAAVVLWHDSSIIPDTNRWVIERCDECAALGSEWTDEEVLAFFLTVLLGR